MSIECPIECLDSCCPNEPGFVEKNGAFILTLVGGVTACMGMVLTYFLKSRCKKVSCLGVSCDRDVIALEANDVKVISSK